MIPDDRRYARTHLWVKVEDDEATVGLTSFAQEQMGEITYVEFSAAGVDVDPGDECGVIESLKAASELAAPVGGRVSEVNGELQDRPEVINESPYDEGWLFRMEDFNEDEVGRLMSADEYARFIQRRPPSAKP